LTAEVHKLKGLTGNLEARELQAAAVEMGNLVRGPTAKTTSEKKLNQKFVELENALFGYSESGVF
jgi:hypothetical protein